MKRKTIMLIAIALFILSGCGRAAADAPQGGDEPVSAPAQSEPYPYPYPVFMPDVSVQSPDEIVPSNEYAPLPEDSNWLRGPAYVDMEQSDLLVMESYPIQVRLHLYGDLPAPCSELRLVIKRDDANRRVDVEAYSVSDPEVMCVAMLEPFDVQVDLGSYSGGKYQVYINGELLGEFDA